MIGCLSPQSGGKLWSRTGRGPAEMLVVNRPPPVTQEALGALHERDRKAAARSMQRLLRPRSVAVIGASRSPGTVGHELVRNLVLGGFQGPVYPVNPTATHIASVPSFASIEDIPGEVDLAVAAVPAKAVPEVVEACGRKGVGGLVIVSSHFAEDGAAGAALEREAVRLAHSYGMRIVGSQPLGNGLQVAVLSNAGGPAVLAVDACESNGLQVPEFSAELKCGSRIFVPITAGPATRSTSAQRQAPRCTNKS